MNMESVKLAKIYNITVFFLLFFFGLGKFLGRYSFSSEFYFLRSLHHSNEYIFYIPFLFLILIPLIDRDWKNKYFLIPIIYGSGIFSGTLFLYFFIKGIINYSQYEFFTMLIFLLFIILSYVIGIFLYQKKLWTFYIYLVLYSFILICNIVITLIPEYRYSFSSNKNSYYFLIPILLLLIIYFSFIIKKYDVKLYKDKINSGP